MDDLVVNFEFFFFFAFSKLISPSNFQFTGVGMIEGSGVNLEER